MATTYRITTKKVNYAGTWPVLKVQDVDAADLNRVLDEMGVPCRADIRRARFDQCQGEAIMWEEIPSETTEARVIVTDGVEHTDDQYPSVLRTEEGPYCGQCNRGWRKGDGAKIRHANGAAVRMCYAVAAEVDADSAAEVAAELANERSFENRGYWETQAEAAWDAQRGVRDEQRAW